MAAAALLRSVASKLARAPPTPTLRGLHAGARSSGAAGSLPPPPTSNQSGGRSVVGTAAAATGLRSAAVLPKVARAPPQPHQHHGLLLGRRGLHTTTAAPPVSADKDAIIQELRRNLWHARAAAHIGCAMLSGIAIYAYFWLRPAAENAKRMLRAIKLRPQDVPTSAYLALLMQIEIAVRRGKRAEKEEYLKFCHMMLEVTAAWEDHGGLKELRDEVARIIRQLESDDDSKQNKGCGS